MSTEPASDEAGATDWAICGLASNHARDDVQRVLLNEWFTDEPWRLEPGVRDLFAHFMHDNLVSERSTRTAQPLNLVLYPPRERAKNDEKRQFTFQATGAINPVISGNSPLAVPGGFFEFTPK